MGSSPESVKIYTDGGCAPNPGPGGWGVVLIFEGERIRELSGSADDTTNNRMELTAAVEALKTLDAQHDVQLFTDSTYVKQGITEWLPNWKQNGWRTQGRSAVKNADLWQELDRQADRHRISWQWVKGHAGHRWNERADELASAAIARSPLPLDDVDAVHIFTGVVFANRSGIGAWAAILSFRDRERAVSAASTDTSANRLHLEAALGGLKALKRKVRVHVYTTSDYVKSGATLWVNGWKARGWKTRDGKEVKHHDLWSALDQRAGQHDVHWHVVDRDHRLEAMKRAKDLARDMAAAP